MLGPVISKIGRVSGSASRSLGTNSPARIPASSTGWRPSRTRIRRPVLIVGRTYRRCRASFAVEFTNGASVFEDRRSVRLQVVEQLGEDLQFEFLERRFRGQDFAFEFLERGRGE